MFLVFFPACLFHVRLFFPPSEFVGAGQTDIPHSTESVLDLDLSNNLIPVCLDLLEELALGWDKCSDSLLERWLGAGSIAAVSLGDDADVLLL